MQSALLESYREQLDKNKDAIVQQGPEITENGIKNAQHLILSLDIYIILQIL